MFAAYAGTGTKTIKLQIQTRLSVHRKDSVVLGTSDLKIAKFIQEVRC